MAKDPAFLFYPNDYMGGTMGMTFEEKGAYMDLLILQFNKGPFTIDQAKKVLNGSFEKLWPVVFEKFVEMDGKFFNQRLEIEKAKRSSFSESRRKNRTSKKTSSTYDRTSEKHMSLHMENENENENENEEVDDFGKSENLLSIPLDSKTLEAAEMNQFQFTKNRNSDFVKAQFEIFKLERVHDPPLKQKEYIKYNARMYSHFLNWIRNKFPKNETNLKPVTGNKQRGAYELLEKARAEHEQRRATGSTG